MADHPFANAGLGMFGADSALARQSSTPEGASEKVKKVLSAMTGGALEALGVSKFLDSLGGGGAEEGGAASIGSGGGGAAVPPTYSIAPAAPISPEGINPMRLPNAMPGGVGFNAQPAGAVNPFQFQINPQPSALPDDEHRNQVKSAWR